MPLLTIIPHEIRDLIYVQLLGDEEVRVDLTTSRGTNFRLREGAPSLSRSELTNLLKARNETLYYEVKHFIHRSVTYFNENGDTLERFPAILGKNLALILRLEVRLNYLVKCKHRYHWPRMLPALLAFRSLEYLRLYSTSEQGKPPYTEAEAGDPAGVSKHQQEVRALRFLGSFTIKRHRNLDLMIQPAHCQPNFVDSQGRAVHEYELHKYYENYPVKVYDGDEIINTTSVRRHKWTEGALASPSVFYIQPGPGQTKADIKSSEVPASNDVHFEAVDNRAYQPAEFFQTRGLQMQFLGGLVEKGRKLEANAASGGTTARTGHIGRRSDNARGPRNAGQRNNNRGHGGGVQASQSNAHGRGNIGRGYGGGGARYGWWNSSASQNLNNHSGNNNNGGQSGHHASNASRARGRGRGRGGRRG